MYIDINFLFRASWNKYNDNGTSEYHSREYLNISNINKNSIIDREKIPDLCPIEPLGDESSQGDEFSQGDVICISDEAEDDESKNDNNQTSTYVKFYVYRKYS